MAWLTPRYATRWHRCRAGNGCEWHTICWCSGVCRLGLWWLLVREGCWIHCHLEFERWFTLACQVLYIIGKLAADVSGPRTCLAWLTSETLQVFFHLTPVKSGCTYCIYSTYHVCHMHNHMRVIACVCAWLGAPGIGGASLKRLDPGLSNFHHQL